MGGAPSTVTQLVLLVLVLLPGVTYQLVREHQRGTVPGERDLGERALRALTASVVLDGLYAVALGPRLLTLYGDPSALTREVRTAALLALLLLFAVPAAAAALISLFERGRLRGRYRRTPSAWDHMFRDMPVSFVRARLKDGTWVGGWYGPRSFASTYPEPPELYLERSFVMERDGTFGPPLPRTHGVYLRVQDVDMIELFGAHSAALPESGQEKTS